MAVKDGSLSRRERSRAGSDLGSGQDVCKGNIMMVVQMVIPHAAGPPAGRWLADWRAMSQSSLVGKKY